MPVPGKATPHDSLAIAKEQSGFWSTLTSGSIILHRETAIEQNNLGIQIECVDSQINAHVRSNTHTILSHFNGRFVGAIYPFVDTVVAPRAADSGLIASDAHPDTTICRSLPQRIDTGTYFVFPTLVDR